MTNFERFSEPSPDYRRGLNNVILILAKDALWLLGVMAFFQIPKLSSNLVIQASAYVAVAFTLIGIFWLIYKQTVWVPPDPDWPQYPQKSGTEFLSKAWWKNAAGAFGVMLGFLGICLQIVFAVFAVTSDDISWTILVSIFFVLYILQLVGSSLTFLVRRRCPYCGHRMEFCREIRNWRERGKEHPQISISWLVCFPCRYRYLPRPMESEAYGNDD